VQFLIVSHVPDALGESFAFDRSAAKVERWLQQPVSPNSLVNERGQSPLWVAASRGDSESVELLLEAEADVNHSNREGATPLVVAARMGSLDCARQLVEARADLNRPDSKGLSPLCMATLKDTDDVVTLLLEARADLEQRDEKKQSPLWIAVKNGCVETATCLAHAGANVNKPDESSSRRHTRLQNGDSLTLHITRVKVQASGFAFAAILGDGSVVTWGNPVFGGHSSAVQDKLKNVQQIQASAYNFAAILADGSIVTWGMASDGADSSAVQDQLKNVQQIQASFGDFAAILGDGSVVTWGDAACGGDSSAVQDQLNNVQQIQASGRAFAAILADGSVVTWGDAANCSAVQDQLKNVQQIQASFGAFAAILGNGSVVTWGRAASGGDSSAVQDQLKNVQQIQGSDRAFAAILAYGSVVTWGSAAHGGDSSAVQDQLKNVQQIRACQSDQLNNVQQIQASAILADGSVVTWGDAAGGGDSSAVQDQLKNVQQIQASGSAFAAILGDGSVVTWGSAIYGGGSSAVQDRLKNVQQIQASFGAFAAILADGSVVTWGDAANGADSSAVQDLLKQPPIMTAVSDGCLDVLEVLLDARADVNQVDYRGYTALHQAALEDSPDAVRRLAAARADLNQTDFVGRAPMSVAAIEGHMDSLEALVGHGAVIDVADNAEKDTPLHFAARAGQEEVVQRLLARRADANRRNQEGRTPLEVAAHSRGPWQLPTRFRKSSPVHEGIVQLFHEAAEGWSLHRPSACQLPPPAKREKRSSVVSGYPPKLFATFGREDVSVYYAVSAVTTSPSAKFILDVADCREKAYSRMPLLATPSETHGVSGFKITKMSKQENGDRLGGVILIGCGVAARCCRWLQTLSTVCHLSACICASAQISGCMVQDHRNSDAGSLPRLPSSQNIDIRGADLPDCCEARDEDAVAHDNRNGTRASVETCVSRLLAMTDLWHDQPRAWKSNISSTSDMIAGDVIVVVVVWLSCFSNAVSCITFTMDGQYLVSGTGSGDIKVWDSTTWAEAAKLRGARRAEPKEVAISPSQRWVVVCYSSVLHIFQCGAPWQLVHSRPVVVDGLKEQPEWCCVAFSPMSEVNHPAGQAGQDNHLAAFSNCNICLMDYSGGWNDDLPQRTRSLMQTSWPVCLAYTGDGYWIICGFSEGLMQVWNAFSLTLEKTLNSHDAAVNSIAAS
ncbi:kidins220b, partial [Symbiodinium sp. KB8]